MDVAHPAAAAVRPAAAAARRLPTESAAALAACLAVSLLAGARLLRPDMLSADALVHLYWMRQFSDGALFTDPLTAALRESARYPDGYQALLHLATHVADPIVFGEWLGIGLMALSGWLVWAIVREHEPWRPAAWIGAGLFLALLEIHRFYGGFPRAFVQPVVLATVLLAIRGRELPAALCAAGGALFYPPAAVLAIGVLTLSAVRRGRRRLAYAAGALALAGAAIAVPELAAGGGQGVLTADQARAFPEFGEHGPLHFFVPSPIEYLRQNRSGFDLRTSGSILAVAALALLALRPASVRLLRPEVLAMPVAALGAFAASQAVLFRLYLPHRYTYPLVAFFAIAVAVSLRPAWAALARSRLRAFALLCAPVVVCAVAIYLFPLAPVTPRVGTATAIAAASAAVALAALAAFVLRIPAAVGAAVTGAVLIAALVLLPDRLPSGTGCPKRPFATFLASLPKDAIVAGDPRDLMCIPATASRAVVISTQLAPSYEAAYFRAGRARMFAALRAYYGPSAAAIGVLQRRYGATHLLVKRDAVRRELSPRGARWRAGQLPYGRFVRGLVRGGEPAVLRLPPACRRWVRGPVEVYEIRCIAGAANRQERVQFVTRSAG